MPAVSTLPVVSQSLPVGFSKFSVSSHVGHHHMLGHVTSAPRLRIKLVGSGACSDGPSDERRPEHVMPGSQSPPNLVPLDNNWMSLFLGFE